jgi:RNA polymerase sigma factor (sigma-70 family)
MFVRNKAELTDAIERVLGGDEDAYELIYRESDRPLRAWLGKRFHLLGPDFIDEVAVRTFEVAFHNLHRFDPERTRFLTWLIWQARSVAKRVRHERFRRRAVSLDEAMHKPWATVPGPAEERERAELYRALGEELDSLPEQTRACVTLFHCQGLTNRQTADRLGIPLIRARRERARALAVLKRRLQERGVRVVERDCTPSPVWHGRDSTGYDDDWTASVTANLPDDPDPLEGRAAKEPGK